MTHEMKKPENKKQNVSCSSPWVAKSALSGCDFAATANFYIEKIYDSL